MSEILSPEDLWDAFLGSGSGAAMRARDAEWSAWAFGSGSQMADELLECVIHGKKRATAGALRSYELDGDDTPRVGEFSIILDGAGSARCVIETTSVEIVPFELVSEEFAAAEGEGDLSLQYWRDGHWRYFGEELAEHGEVPTMDMPVVCERFELVYVAP